jgi:hypothetical protein
MRNAALWTALFLFVFASMAGASQLVLGSDPVKHYSLWPLDHEGPIGKLSLEFVGIRDADARSDGPHYFEPRILNLTIGEATVVDHVKMPQSDSFTYRDSPLVVRTTTFYAAANEKKISLRTYEQTQNGWYMNARGEKKEMLLPEILKIGGGHEARRYKLVPEQNSEQVLAQLKAFDFVKYLKEKAAIVRHFRHASTVTYR